MTKTNSKIQTWLAIINILLTAVIGIGIALFLDYRDKQFQSEMKLRDEQFQINLTELKTKLESQVNLTNLSIETSNSTSIPLNCVMGSNSPCDSWAIIRNSGNVPAKNVKIIITLDTISNEWIDIINDINAFSYAIYPPINSQTKIMKVGIFNQLISDGYKVPGENEVEISIDSLPVNSSTRILFELSPLIQTAMVKTEQTITLYTPDNYDYLGYLGYYLKYANPMAYFRAYATCENCKENESNALKYFSVSNLSTWNTNNLQPTGIVKNPDRDWVTKSVDIQLECIVPTSVTTYSCNSYNDVYCDSNDGCRPGNSAVR